MGLHTSSGNRRWRQITVDDEALTILALYKYRYRLRTYSDAVKLMHTMIVKCSGKELGE